MYQISIFSDAKVQLQIAENENIIEENKSINLSLSEKDDSIKLMYKQYNGWRQVNCFIAGSTKQQSERDALRSSISIACNRWSRKNFHFRILMKILTESLQKTVNNLYMIHLLQIKQITPFL